VCYTFRGMGRCCSGAGSLDSEFVGCQSAAMIAQESNTVMYLGGVLGIGGARRMLRGGCRSACSGPGFWECVVRLPVVACRCRLDAESRSSVVASKRSAAQYTQFGCNASYLRGRGVNSGSGCGRVEGFAVCLFVGVGFSSEGVWGCERCYCSIPATSTHSYTLDTIFA
jgi:hypothetical protein